MNKNMLCVIFSEKFLCKGFQNTVEMIETEFGNSVLRSESNFLKTYKDTS